MAATLNYWRADNMWAAAGRPDGSLGQESVTVTPENKRVFVTDWRYEKQTNDGSNYYGSHGRKLVNAGTDTLRVRLTGTRDGATAQELVHQVIRGGFVITLKPGATVLIKNDISEVSVAP